MASDLDMGARPGRAGRVIRLNPKTSALQMDWLALGLLPHDTTDATSAPRPIHARAETVAELPMFADAFQRRRAIVPATKCYQRRTGGGQPHRFAISRQDGQPMAIAGLWESYVWPGGQTERTYCIITQQTRSSQITRSVHPQGRTPIVKIRLTLHKARLQIGMLNNTYGSPKCLRGRWYAKSGRFIRFSPRRAASIFCTSTGICCTISPASSASRKWPKRAFASSGLI